MKTKIIAIVTIVVIAVGGTLFLYKNTAAPSNETAPLSLPAEYKNATYGINGTSIQLTNGYAETEIAPGSASKLITRYFGNEATGDLTGSGMSDVAFLITQTGGGSGTFYYVVAALKTPSGYKGTNAILLGDRIAPQVTEIKNGEIIVNYADRKPGEPMTKQPSIGVSKYLRLENGVLVESIR